MNAIIGTGLGGMTGSTLFVVIAGILLLVSKKKGAVAYRWACVFLALGSASVVRASAALIMLLSSFVSV